MDAGHIILGAIVYVFFVYLVARFIHVSSEKHDRYVD